MMVAMHVPAASEPETSSGRPSTSAAAPFVNSIAIMPSMIIAAIEMIEQKYAYLSLESTD